MSEQPIRPDEVEITVYEYISKAIAVLEHTERIRRDAQRRLHCGVPLGDPAPLAQAKRYFDQLARPLVTAAYTVGVEASALAEFIRTGDARLVHPALGVLDRLQTMSLKAGRGSRSAEGLTPDETVARPVAEGCDLLDELRGETSKRSDSSAAAVPGRRAPLSLAQQEVWDLLQGQALLAKEIARKVCGAHNAEDAIRKRIATIRNTGRNIANQRGHGYYRPDAPPTEWTGAERESG